MLCCVGKGRSGSRRNVDAPLRKDAETYGEHDPMLKDNVLYAGLHASGCTTYWHVLEIGALCAVGPSAAFGLAFQAVAVLARALRVFAFTCASASRQSPRMSIHKQIYSP